jgi:hypothetical protein
VLNNTKSISDPAQRTRLVVAATGEFFNMLNAQSSFGFSIVGQAQTVNALRNAVAGVSGRSDLPSEAAKAPPTDAELLLDIGLALKKARIFHVGDGIQNILIFAVLLGFLGDEADDRFS